MSDVLAYEARGGCLEFSSLDFSLLFYSKGLPSMWREEAPSGVCSAFTCAPPCYGFKVVLPCARLFSVFFLCNLPFFVGCGVSVWPRLWRFSSMIPLDCKDGWLLRYAISSLLVLGSALKASEESELEAIIKE
ncbi:unnamed protein product [Brassica rapa subsp. trilocularis]